MSLPVWVWEYDYPVGYEREYEEREIEMSPGYEVGVVRGLAHSGADGMGGISSHKGRLRFVQIEIKNTQYYGIQDYKNILAFLMARKDLNNEKFYFYNMHENDCLATWTGETPSSGYTSGGVLVDNTIGRYVVRHKGAIPWQLAKLSLVDFSLRFDQVFR